ncbi:MAG: F0F1 ATP synthase subunit A [Planctomycetaceae bacterium]
MAAHNPIYHLKDCYFFEVPKALWRYDWRSLDDVPRFLRDGHPEVTDPAVFKEAMDGKVLIPQPFGELHSLYAMKSGFGISKYMILELVVATVMVLLFTRLAARVRGGDPPRGRLTNMLESVVVFVRDQIARPAIDSHDHHDDDHGHEEHGHAVAHAVPAHDGDRFVPLLLTLFFFVLGCNLLGMVPWAGSPTASFSVTLSLAAVTFLTVIVAGMLKFGVLGFFTNQVPSMDLPLPLAIVLKPMIFAIEMLGLCIKHLILAVRLLANMVAGHLVLLGIMGLISAAAAYSTGMWATVTGISVVSCTLFSLLELFVAFLQAYIFTFLSALFIGAAVHQH